MLNYESTYQLKLRRTKIIATIGLTGNQPDLLRQMIISGMNVARINFSHGTHEQHLEAINNIRKVSADLDIPVAILGDLSGPKIRVGKFKSGHIGLIDGDEVFVTTEDVLGEGRTIPSQYTSLIQDIKPEQKILLDDGRLVLKVLAIESETTARCLVIHGGILKNHKGMNLPGSALSIPAVTPKDELDLAFCITHNFDYVALSFVRRAAEIIDLKEKIKRLTEALPEPPTALTHVIAKIEKPQALEEIESIIDAADGIMIARGDLGVELPATKVPIIQTQLIKLANQRNTPVIVATQMLESMLTEVTPTRAEVSDVATAVLSYADAVMLSGETAVGRYPIRTIETMDSILREVETYQWSQGLFGQLQSDISIYAHANALARAATLLSQDMEIRSLNVQTVSGYTAKIISVARPNSPILAYCNDPKVIRQMMLYWGVFPIYHEKATDTEYFTQLSNETVKEMGIAEPGNYILMISTPVISGTNHNLSSIVLGQVI